MHTRLTVLVIAGLGLAAANVSAQHASMQRTVRELRAAYQGRNRGPEQTEPFSRKIRLGRDGRVSVSNIAGSITVTGGSGDELSIEAVKRTRGDRSELADVHIVVDERAGRVDIRTDHTGRTDHVSVDYTIALPASASIDVKSISGDLKVTGVQGVVRAESISGTLTASGTPRLELAKSVSGNVDISGVIEGDLNASSISGNVHAKDVKARSLQIGTVSGDVIVADATCERVEAKSLSGTLEYAGTLERGGKYALTTHSGSVRFAIAGNTGFELVASTFSGSIRSDVPITMGGSADPNIRRRGMNNRSIRGTFGDGSAALTIRTFSGNIVVARR